MKITLGALLKAPADLHAKLEQRSDENAKEIANALMDKFTGKKTSSPDVQDSSEPITPVESNEDGYNKGMSAWNNKWGW